MTAMTKHTATASSSGAIGKADIVLSINGRDAGKYFLVIETQTGYSFLADGKGRKIGKPKKKKNKHLKLEDKATGIIASKIINGEVVTNNEIKKALAMFRTARAE